MQLNEIRAASLRPMYERHLATVKHLHGEIAKLIESGDFGLARQRVEDLDFALAQLNATANALADVS